MSQEFNLDALLAQLFQGADFPPLNIVRLEYSPQDKGAFVLYDDKGDAYGGDCLEAMGDTEAQKAYLLEALEDGTLAQEFAQYEAVDPEVLAEKLGLFSDWEVLYAKA